jgi:hypothetical protein
MAARRSSPSVVEFVLDHGGDVAIGDDLGRSPLHDAVIISVVINRNTYIPSIEQS